MEKGGENAAGELEDDPARCCNVVNLLFTRVENEEKKRESNISLSLSFSLKSPYVR